MSSRNKIEVQVIDEKLLIAGLKAYDDELTEAEAARRGEINLIEMAPQSQNLVMSFQNIGKIENLVGFANLSKLCLDNNLIEDIVNLESLSKLRWLDLSFNQIRKIKGLENLKLLEDLSLYSNKISLVEGLEHCPRLQCLSLGKNRIASLDQVIKLRQLKSIQMLTLSGNPICTETEYKMIVLAYVDNLKYLDYALVTSADLTAAKEQYHDELLDVLEKESVMAEKEARDVALSKYIKELDAAGIVFAHTLFDDMFFEDSDIEKLRHLPGIKELIEQFRSSFKNVSEDFVRASMEKYEKKRIDIANFDVAVATIRGKADTESTMLIDSFNTSKKATIAALNDESTLDNIEFRQRLVGKMFSELDRVHGELMTLEIKLVEQYEVLVDEYDNHLNEFKNVALEMQQLFFRSVEELEDKFSAGVRSVATDLIDRLSREELAEDYLDEEAMSLVVDKDACLSIVSTSHDMHIGRILKREDDARNTETRRYQEIVNGSMNAERARNRGRILQIHDFVRNSKHSLQSLLAADEEDGEADEGGN